jgi:hypothetical protein
MAKISTPGTNTKLSSKVNRPGIHAKTKTSKLKRSKNYKKTYKGQGK